MNPTTNEVLEAELRQAAIVSLAKKLTTLGVTYVLQWGDEGETLASEAGLELRVPKPTNRGERSSHAQKHLAGLAAGDIRHIPPLEGYTLAQLASSVSAQAYKMCGAGNYRCAQAPDGSGVLLLCVALEGEDSV